MKGHRGWLVAVIVAIVGATWWIWRGGQVEVADASAEEQHASQSARMQGSNARHHLERDVRKESRGTISGKVSSSEGAPLGGAKICASTDAAELDTQTQRTPVCTTADPKGHYALEGLFAVAYRVSASAPSHQPAIWADPEAPRSRRHEIRLTAGATVEGVDLVLETGGVPVRGVVKDLSGGSVAGAWVQSGGADWGSAGAWSTAATDDEGQFELWVAPGKLTVRAAAEGYTGASKAGVAPGQTFEIFLTPASTLVGKVEMAGTGDPVEGARVVAAQSAFGGDRTMAFSSPDGSFRIEGIEPGRYEIRASTPELFGMSREAIHLGLVETSEPVLIEVHPAFSVEGFVMVAGTNEPCPAGWIRLESKDGDDRAFASLEPEGKAVVRALQPGTYETHVNCEGHAAREAYDPIVITDASLRDLIWEVDPGAVVRGVVVHADGTPAEDLRVNARPVLGEDSRPRRVSFGGDKTQADGRFELAGLLPGKYQLDIWSGRGLQLASKPEIEVGKDDEKNDLRLELQATGMLEGFVRDERGEPVGGATVAAQDDRRLWSNTTTLDDGSFRFENLTIGSVRVQAQRNWRAMRAPGQSDDDVAGERVTVTAGETTRVDLVVEGRNAVIRGKVVDPDGGPVPDAFVDLERESDSAAKTEGAAKRQLAWGWSRQPVLTDMDGNFELDELAEGSYTLKAYRQGGGEGVLEGVATGSDVTVTLETPGTLEGTVSMDGGPVPERFTINLTDREAGVHLADTFFRTDGTWRLTNVPEGRYTLVAQAANGDGETQVELAAGESKADVTIALTGRVTVHGKVVDLETREPVAGMRVQISRRGGSFGMSFAPGDGKGMTDETGRFELDRVSIGPSSAVVIPNGFGVGGYPFTWTHVIVPSGTGVVELAPIEVAKKRLEDGEAAGSLGLQLEQGNPTEEAEDRRLIVALVRPGGAAARAGIRPGDEIVKVDGHDVTGAKYNLFHALTSAPAGRVLELGLADDRAIAVTLGPAE
jgi:hypothetical protein